MQLFHTTSTTSSVEHVFQARSYSLVSFYVVMAKLDFSPTPNPNSYKCSTAKGRFTDEGMEVYNDPAAAEGHPLAERLFALPGVSNVFITPQFITISKQASTAWDPLLKKVERVLSDFLDEQPAS